MIIKKRIFSGWVLFLCLLLSIRVVAESELSRIDNCDFYDQLESIKHCGPKGYFQRFAGPYCNAYLNRNPHFTFKGQKILKGIRQCLQDELRGRADSMSCEAIEQFGVDSHEVCYLRSGFCDLRGKDLALVYEIAIKEILNPKMRSLIYNVYKKCWKKDLSK